MEMKTLLIVDLVQSILIFFGCVGMFFTIGKDVTPPASKIVPEIPLEIMEELKEEVSAVCKSSLDVMAEHRRGILGGSAAVLFTLIFLGLLICSLLRRKDGMLGNETATTRPQTTRHLLDLTEDERWRYIEAKEKGDLEEQMEILRGCGCKDDADKCSECSDDCKCQEVNVKNEMEMIK